MGADHLSHDIFIKYIYIKDMKKIYIAIFSLLLTSSTFAAGGDGGGSSEASLYDDAVKLVKRAGKLEKKEKLEKANKLYSEAFTKFEKALKKDKKNPDILNYMGFTSRKTGNFKIAEKFYLQGLSINPKHNGINEYLGELYVQTNRMDKANERLEVLKSCNCKEFGELELIIKTRGTKIYQDKSTANFLSFSIGISFKVFIFVFFKKIEQAASSSIALAYQVAQTHQQSPSFKPGKPNSGCGVIKSLPTFFDHSKNLSVTFAQTVWTPLSFLSVLQHPSLNQPVNGSFEQGSNGSPKTFF